MLSKFDAFRNNPFPMFGPIAFLSSLMLWKCLSTSVRKTPLARKIPTLKYFGRHPSHGDQYRGENLMDPPKELVDPYHWLRDDTREKKEVIDYLKLENKFCESGLSYLSGLQDELYREMISHLKETDEDLPHQHGPYYYYSKTLKGLSYKIHCRKTLDTEAVEAVILDENKLAEGFEYTDINSFDPSPSHNLLAYVIDHSGYETYSLKIRNLLTNNDLPDEIDEMSGDMVWGADDSSIFYTTMDEEHRPYKLWLHVLGTPQSDDVCIFTEEDSRFWLGVDKSSSDAFLVFGVESKETSEQFVADLRGVSGADAHKRLAEDPARVVCVRQRRQGVRYDLDHQGDYFYIVTNDDGAKNNKLVRVPVSSLLQQATSTSTSTVWESVRPYNPSEQIEDILPFANHIVVFGRAEGVPRVWVISTTSSSVDTLQKIPLLSDWKQIEFKESDFSVSSDANYVFDTYFLRVSYSSLVTPSQILDINLNTGELTVKKQKEIPNYNPDNYICSRAMAEARDGTKVPLSIVHHRNVNLIPNSEAKKNPVLLYGYGSYGVCIDPTFDFKRLSLLDRGVVYVIAHIRGGGEMGRSWYEDEGKYLTKMNTFHDFIDCAKDLVGRGVTSTSQLACVGRSAGGLLIGTVINLAPEVFKVAVADVPFVDVVNTMSDPTIPLTVTEWEEWGNPNEEKFFEYMRSYSPYDNVSRQNYPSLLVTAGLNDPRVAYWEPAKWVAKLRSMKVDINPLYLKTDMSTGHFSASDRYKFVKETAFEYSFILDQIGATKKIID